MSTLLDSLKYIAAPMVNQSDLPFRSLVHEHGCTTSYTQMFTPNMLTDPDFRDLHMRDLQQGHAAGIGPVVAQIAGNDVESLVQSAKQLVPWVDGIGALISFLIQCLSLLTNVRRQTSILDVHKITLVKVDMVHIFSLRRIGLFSNKSVRVASPSVPSIDA
jgi:hypothetical protein